MPEDEADRTNDPQPAGEEAAPSQPDGSAPEPAPDADASTPQGVDGALDDARAAVEEISQEAGSAAAPEPGGEGGEGADLAAFALSDFAASQGLGLPENIDLLSDVKLNVKIELGRTTMLVEDVLRLGEGCVVELDKLAGDPVDIYVNNRHIARGEVLVLNDNFCVRINEILSQAIPEAGPAAEATPAA
jgi:flagellar motor switch protein FliN/FliY